jgi:hypothetical protein
MCVLRSSALALSPGGALVSFPSLSVGSPLFSFRGLAWSAWLCGGLLSVSFRPSSRSFSGAVLVARFRSPAAASRFARRWALRLGVPVFVRRSGVSVPVSGPGFPLPGPWFGFSVPVSGLGLRGFVRALAAPPFEGASRA